MPPTDDTPEGRLRAAALRFADWTGTKLLLSEFRSLPGLEGHYREGRPHAVTRFRHPTRGDFYVFPSAPRDAVAAASPEHAGAWLDHAFLRAWEQLDRAQSKPPRG